MKKIRKGKIMLVLLIVVLLVVAAFFIIKFINKEPETPDTPIDEQTPAIQLPDTTYSEMQVTDILIEYRETTKETVLTFTINNTTTQKVEEQFFKSVLIDDNEQILAEMTNVYIQSLEVGQQHRVTVVYDGDLTATKQIKLVAK